MKKIIILSAITLLFTACSKNEEDYVPSISKENIEIHRKTFDDAVGFLEMNASIGLQEAADFVESLEGVTNVSITDSIIRATTLGNVTFTLDFNSYPEFEDESIDVEELQQRIDDLDNAIEANIANGYEKTSDVFKEYIASNTHYDNTYTANASTRASSAKNVRLSRRNVAIWNPWKDFSNETKRVDAVTHFINQEHPLQEFTTFTPTSFCAFKNFDLVYISSHGYKNGDIILPFDCLTQEQLKLYNNELGSVGLYWEKDRGKKQYKGLLLTEKFFEKYLPDLSNTIIYTSACYLGVNNSSFLNSCLKKNVADYFASDDMCTCKHILRNFEEFYIYLMYGYSSNKSFVNGKGYFIGSYVHNNKPCTYKYSRYGSKLVYYPTPHATGIGNRSNASKAQTRGDGSDASSIVVNVQLRYATEDSGDILKTIEAGICLQDMETKEVKLIPFSNKNMVSTEKKSYGDVTVSNIAASLDDLTEEHKYAYCCYTKVDGEITLSDETYKFSNSKNYKLYLKYSWTTKQKHYNSLYGTTIKDVTNYNDHSATMEIIKQDGVFYFCPTSDGNYNIYSSDHDLYLCHSTDVSGIHSSCMVIGNYTTEFCPNRGYKNSILSVSVYEDNIRIKYSFDDPGGMYKYYHQEKEYTMNHLDSTPELVISSAYYYGGTNSKCTFRYDYESNYSLEGWERY
ncbi:MAG: hypothetical protein IJS63_09585 [Bacteroidaceae bacterium]|nr:hypothetical protein [Bacteroidaceae bacterium]